MIAHEKQIAQEERKKQQELEKQKALEKSRLEQVYHEDILNISDQSSQYFHDRQNALQRTKDQNYKTYKQTRDLDEQTIGLCIAKNINYHTLQSTAGTEMQQQLYDEVADCYKKIAQILIKPGLTESILAQQSVEFAQCSAEATRIEMMELAIALSDMAHCCCNTVCSVIVGIGDGVESVINVVKDPVGTAKNLGHSLGKVMNYVAEAMVYADSESFGWSEYTKILEQEHHYDAVYAQQVVDAVKDWVIQSSGQEKVRVVTRFAVEGMLYAQVGAVLSHARKTCCSLVADVAEIRCLAEFTDIYTEYGLSTELGEVGLNSLEDLSISLMKSEIDNFRKSKSITKAVNTPTIQTSKNFVQASTNTRTISEVLDELRQYGAKSRAFQRKVRCHFNDLFYKDELLGLYKEFKNPLCMEIVHNQEKVKIFCDLEHIMTYNLKFKLNKETGLIEGFISGGHVGKYTKDLEKAGVIKVAYEEMLPGGARAIEYKHAFGSFSAIKTEFPLSWTAQNIVESIEKIWKNPKFYKFEGKEGRIVGMGKDDLMLDMFFKKLPDGNFRVKSVYPYYKEFSKARI